MTKEEAIVRIKHHMEVHHIGEYPHIHIKEALSMAIAALREQEERENLNPRKIQKYPGTKNVWTYYTSNTQNPCECGSNCYHYEYDGQKVIGVCNACSQDIYEVKSEYVQEYLDKGIWE